MKRRLWLTGACLAVCLFVGSSAQANHGYYRHGYRPGFSFGIYAAPPVYVAPPPPVVYAPPPGPVYVAPPAPAYYYPAPYYQSFGVRTPGFSFFYGR
jgi:hypothetical protein